ncbi:hypothetical protein METBIDRAFT_47781 [Metschnikowia bicuspidata var. bicuspidata NRRL YB-4993]|uniref:Metacaspase-1 n=1 Tax=Metschnikowia bicuspidata var. bicuspidata NRRL YB-4993 TaxID=869754 RepID=A0A1A0H1Z7_9ASCO|nr:hypothetical protein METBIDRAFT_47781 [Metschnikowia bicuspidata var. bicuspidata NRRL YB-4993]OBA17947.1 hypothetical protein METBIDRAFT_47781 [Metschnikowia bicuspidata var. bicuspidata NRRL YB-4993]
MFPGSGGHSYNNSQGHYQGGYPNQQSNYGYQGPPPSNPNGPPPGNYYGGPPGPPQNGYYGRPPPGPPHGPPPHSQWIPQGGNLNSSLNNSSHAPTSAPPSAPQSFGQSSNMTFQYSNCTGKKKALLIGINYYGSKNELRGCVNDVKNMSKFLNQYYGYSYDDMVILTDDQREIARLPTRDNIIRAMQWLTKNAAPNDSYFFHISSHGGLVPDQNGDEESGFDSCVYPLDFETAGPIIDDEMHDLMVKPLPPGCRLVALYDACHSGTALDLPFVYSTKGVVKEPNLWKDAGSGALKAFMNYEAGNISGAMSAVSGIFKKVTNYQSTDRDKIVQSKMSSADVISLSGCKDDQTSADAVEAGQSTGAMSWAFISVLTQSRNQSYLSLLNNMRSILSAKYSQKPQLSASHPQDMNLAFIM